MPGGYRNPKQEGSTFSAAEILWVQTGNAGVLLLKEQSSSPSATPGYGKLYSKTDGKLYFLNDAGTEIQLAGGVTALPVWGERFVGPASSCVLAHTPTSAGIVRAYRGGGRQDQGGGSPDYTMAGNTATLSTPLATGEVILFDYNY